MKFVSIIILFFTLTLNARQQNNDLFEGHSGTMVVYDLNKDEYLTINGERAALRFTPASTFKIPNSLIGLETGIIKDENFIIAWDGNKRWNQEWNRDHTLGSAIKLSVVPYYQELARRVGKEKMERFLSLMDYGNKTIGERVDSFWLDGSLVISADEQIDFMKKFYNYKLPVSKRSVDIVKKIMSEEKYSASILKYKTGTGTKSSGEFIGWLVGYVEKGNEVFLFAFNVDAKTFDETMEIRTRLSRKILKELKILE
ncbi:MAG TPA: class D beta-lactamase [Melioribacteraceae bacterium]|nr:class D beta-lactamase [Melioribacteraceae bacterium]